MDQSPELSAECEEGWGGKQEGRGVCVWGGVILYQQAESSHSRCRGYQDPAIQ